MESSDRVLVVAHRTAATSSLLDAVRERAQRSSCVFTLLVPKEAHGLHRVVDPEDQDAGEAQQILDEALPRLSEAAGAPVEGIIGAPAPLTAIEDAVNARGFDEIIISTLPVKWSRWVRLDLPSKAAGLGLPVTTITANDLGSQPPSDVWDRRGRGTRRHCMDRREFLVRAATVTAAPVLLGRPAAASAAASSSLALVTADTESHVGIVSLGTGRLIGRIATREGPRSIERGRGRNVIVAHTSIGAISLLEGRPARVRRVLGGFGEPRYTAMVPRGRYAFVTDSGHGEIATVDLRAGRVVHRFEVGALARHVTIDPAGRTLWVAMGSSASSIVVVDVTDPLRPRIRRRITPRFLAHDVGFSPSGRRVWVTSGRVPQLMVYAAGGSKPVRVLGADTAPQHVGFGGGVAYVASGEGRSLRVHDLRDGRIRRSTRVPLGSYNVQRGAGRVLTPSLNNGALTILDAHGKVRHEVRVAAAAHDTCALV